MTESFGITSGSAETVTKFTTVAAVLLPAAAVWMRAVSFCLSSASVPASTALALPVDQLALQGVMPVAPAVVVAAIGTFAGRRMARWLRNIPIHNWELPAAAPSWARMYRRQALLAAACSLLGIVALVVTDTTHHWVAAAISATLLFLAALCWAIVAAYQVEGRSTDRQLARAHAQVRSYRVDVAVAERQLRRAIESFKVGAPDVAKLMEQLEVAEERYRTSEVRLKSFVEARELAFPIDRWAAGYWVLVVVNAVLAVWAMVVGLPASAAVIAATYIVLLVGIAMWMARPEVPSNWELAGGTGIAIVLAATVFGAIPIHHARIELSLSDPRTEVSESTVPATLVGEDDTFFYGWRCPAGGTPSLQAIARDGVQDWTRDGSVFRLGWGPADGQEPTLQVLVQTNALMPLGLDPAC